MFLRVFRLECVESKFELIWWKKCFWKWFKKVLKFWGREEKKNGGWSNGKKKSYKLWVKSTLISVKKDDRLNLSILG